jgi:hypothetical protein
LTSVSSLKHDPLGLAGDRKTEARPAARAGRVAREEVVEHSMT